MNFNDRDILQWAMGWSWPIITALAVLMAWGIARLLFWREKEITADEASGPMPGKGCVCRCEDL